MTKFQELEELLHKINRETSHFDGMKMDTWNDFKNFFNNNLRGIELEDPYYNRIPSFVRNVEFDPQEGFHKSLKMDIVSPVTAKGCEDLVHTSVVNESFLVNTLKRKSNLERIKASLEQKTSKGLSI